MRRAVRIYGCGLPKDYSSQDQFAKARVLAEKAYAFEFGYARYLHARRVRHVFWQQPYPGSAN